MMEQQSGTDGIAPGSAVPTNDRPLSLYDNLTTPVASAPGAGSGARTIHFPDIQFRFDESIAATTPPPPLSVGVSQPLDRHRRSHRNSARLNFFGLSSSTTCPPGRTDAADDGEQEDHRNGRTTPLPPGAPSMASSKASASKTDDAVDMSTLSALDSSASPNSTASTVLLSSAYPSPTRESPGQQQLPVTPRTSRPNSSIKTITIQLPTDAAINRGSPSEAVYMTTTVPQNFAKNASTLIGRHKPTRSSLRHSRMLLQNNSCKAFQQQRYQHGNSLNLRHLRLSKGLMVLQILIGALLSLIGLTIMVWSPSTHIKDNPYWSGLTLVLCGTLFLVLFAFKRSGRQQRLVVGSGVKVWGVVAAATTGAATSTTGRPPVSRNCVRENCFHVLRVNALVVLVLTIFFTLLAFIYALIHATNLSSPDMRCVPEFSFNVNASTCVCTLDQHRAVTKGSGGEAEPPASTNQSLEKNGHRLEYRDFNCNEVLGIWYYVMIVSTVLNSLGCLLAASFLLIYGIECMRRDGILNSPALLQRETNREGAPAGHGEMDTDGGTADDPMANFKHCDPASNQPLLATVRILETNRVKARAVAVVQQPDSISLRARAGGSDHELPP